MYVENCYKSLYNAITRREHEKTENKCLLDKKQRIDAIAMHMRKEGATDDQVAEVSFEKYFLLIKLCQVDCLTTIKKFTFTFLLI